jgi:hypothetical protein
VSGQEGKNERCNLVILLIQSEMAGVEQMDLGAAGNAPPP